MNAWRDYKPGHKCAYRAGKEKMSSKRRRAFAHAGIMPVHETEDGSQVNHIDIGRLSSDTRNTLLAGHYWHMDGSIVLGVLLCVSVAQLVLGIVGAATVSQGMWYLAPLAFIYMLAAALWFVLFAWRRPRPLAYATFLALALCILHAVVAILWFSLFTRLIARSPALWWCTTVTECVLALTFLTLLMVNACLAHASLMASGTTNAIGSLSSVKDQTTPEKISVSMLQFDHHIGAHCGSLRR